MIRTFHFSSNVVGGYQVKVNLDEANSVEDVEQLCMAQLLETLTDYESFDLLSKVENRKFHIHDVTIEEIKDPNNSRMFYICDMCSTQNTS
jgi:hypothetical protein